MAKPELVYVHRIKATPEKIWQALTDPAFTARYWYGTRVESDWKVGSPITFVKPEGMGAPDTGKVLVADKPRTLSFSWHIAWGEMAKEKDSRVTFTLEPDGDAVKLTLVHDEFEEGSKAYENAEERLEGHPRRPDQDRRGSEMSTRFVYVTYIQTTPQKLWDALLKPEFTKQYFFGVTHGERLEGRLALENGSPGRFGHRRRDRSGDRPAEAAGAALAERIREAEAGRLHPLHLRHRRGKRADEAAGHPRGRDGQFEDHRARSPAAGR